MPRGNPRNKVLQLRLTDAELEALRAVADHRGWPMSILMRDLVRRELQRAQERGHLLDFSASNPELNRQLEKEGVVNPMSKEDQIKALSKRILDGVDRERADDDDEPVRYMD